MVLNVRLGSSDSPAQTRPSSVISPTQPVQSHYHHSMGIANFRLQGYWIVACFPPLLAVLAKIVNLCPIRPARSDYTYSHNRPEHVFAGTSMATTTVLHEPRLDTILMVENQVQKARSYPTKRSCGRSFPGRYSTRPSTEYWTIWKAPTRF